jgi:hypothetical protein
MRRWPLEYFALGVTPEAGITPEAFRRYGHVHRAMLADVMAGCRTELSRLAA